MQHGKVIALDGSHKNPVTDGYICAKVRKFDERLYGPDRLLYPGRSQGRKGEGRFKRVTWDEALELVAERFRRAKAAHGGASILPFSYGGSNGLLTQDNLDAQLWRRFGTSRLARTLCAAPTGAANQALYGKMPSVTYQDYPEARADRPVGRQPVGLGHPSRAVRPRGAEARREARRHRSAHDRAGAGGRYAPPGEARHRRRRRSGDPSVSVRERPRRRARSSAITRAAPIGLRERAEEWTIERAAATAGVDPAGARAGRRSCTRESSPALIRCGWGLERNRNGGNAAMAVLALPAVGGKFGVRGGGYSMSNSASWNITRPWIGERRAATRAS